MNLTPAQEQLKAKHGTPEEFNHALLRAAMDFTITPKEAEVALAKYKQEWAAADSASGQIIHKLTHGEPEGWPDPVAMQEAWQRDDEETDRKIARKYANSIIEWIAGPVPWQEWERVDMVDAILRAIHEAKGIAPFEQNNEVCNRGSEETL